MDNSHTDPLLAHDRVEAALEAAGVGVWEMDLDTRRFTCSARCKKLFGFAQELPVLFENLLLAAHPIDRALLEQHINQALDPAGDGRFSLEYRVVHPDGEVRWVRSTGLAIFDPITRRALQFHGATRDITEIHEQVLTQEAQLREFKLLAEQAPDILWIAQANGNVTYCNPRWEEYTGKPAQLPGGWQHGLHPEDQARCLAQWLNSLQTRAPFSVECRLQGADGVYRWFLNRALFVKPATSEEPRWLGCCTNVHAQVEAVAALHQQVQDQQQRLAQLASGR